MSIDEATPQQPTRNQRSRDDHSGAAAGGPSISSSANRSSSPNRSALTTDNSAALASAMRISKSIDALPRQELQVQRSNDLSDPFLALAAAMVDDLEAARTAADNRLRILTTPADKADADGVGRGFGLTSAHRDVARLEGMCLALAKAENDAILTLRSVVRRHPLWPWAAPLRGVGEKQFARLLASVGDPYWNELHDRPRTVSELWAYSGLHTLPASHVIHGTHREVAGGSKQASGGTDQVGVDAHRCLVRAAARRQRGQKANWSAEAKMRTFLIAQSCLKQTDAACKSDDGLYRHYPGCTCSSYRLVYDQRREHTAQTHADDWSLLHAHNDAIRISGKALLKDLWREARRLHGVQSD